MCYLSIDTAVVLLAAATVTFTTACAIVLLFMLCSVGTATAINNRLAAATIEVVAIIATAR
jgi:hypothetical protein